MASKGLYGASGTGRPAMALAGDYSSRRLLELSFGETREIRSITQSPENCLLFGATTILGSLELTGLAVYNKRTEAHRGNVDLKHDLCVGYLMNRSGDIAIVHAPTPLIEVDPGNQRHWLIQRFAVIAAVDCTGAYKVECNRRRDSHANGHSQVLLSSITNRQSLTIGAHSARAIAKGAGSAPHSSPFRRHCRGFQCPLPARPSYQGLFGRPKGDATGCGCNGPAAPMSGLHDGRCRT